VTLVVEAGRVHVPDRGPQHGELGQVESGEPAAHRLERSASGGNPVELLVDGSLEPLQADREQVQARLGHGTAAQRVDDLRPAGWADRLRHGDYAPRNCWRSSGRLSFTSRSAAEWFSTA
jgi:hypothetical protein